HPDLVFVLVGLVIIIVRLRPPGVVVEHLVHQDVGGPRQPDQVRAGGGVTREHDRTGGGVEAVGEGGEDGWVADQDGGDPDVVILLHQQRLHAGRHPVGGAGAQAGREGDLVGDHQGGQVAASGLAHAD